MSELTSDLPTLEGLDDRLGLFRRAYPNAATVEQVWIYHAASVRRHIEISGIECTSLQARGPRARKAVPGLDKPAVPECCCYFTCPACWHVVRAELYDHLLELPPSGPTYWIAQRIDLEPNELPERKVEKVLRPDGASRKVLAWFPTLTLSSLPDGVMGLTWRPTAVLWSEKPIALKSGKGKGPPRRHLEACYGSAEGWTQPVGGTAVEWYRYEDRQSLLHGLREIDLPVAQLMPHVSDVDETLYRRAVMAFIEVKRKGTRARQVQIEQIRKLRIRCGMPVDEPRDSAVTEEVTYPRTVSLEAEARLALADAGKLPQKLTDAAGSVDRLVADATDSRATPAELMALLNPPEPDPERESLEPEHAVTRAVVAISYGFLGDLPATHGGQRDPVGHLAALLQAGADAAITDDLVQRARQRLHEADVQQALPRVTDRIDLRLLFCRVGLPLGEWEPLVCSVENAVLEEWKAAHADPATKTLAEDRSPFMRLLKMMKAQKPPPKDLVALAKRELMKPGRRFLAQQIDSEVVAALDASGAELPDS